MQDITNNDRPYEFVKHIESKPCVYVLSDKKNPMHVKMFLTEDEYLNKIPKSQQIYYVLCS